MEKMYKYPIKVVSQITGLSVFVIRAWEKRYEVVTPSRTDTNRRLYSEEDIEKLKLLNEAIHNGHNIGGVASLSVNELKTILGNKSSITTTAKIESNENTLKDTKSLIDDCISAVKVYDAKTLETHIT